ncbi:hypothetical protein [Bradyrhizobium elkanii]|nr:hypothetical protein [Bradyrhizobium elkanii]MCP1909681.1 hypothetical protein [Bradyrhizobium elkanii]
MKDQSLKADEFLEPTSAAVDAIFSDSTADFGLFIGPRRLRVH